MKGYNTYIGARYVPIVMGNWNAETAYEPLSIVMYEGNSYTSRTFVPAGTPVSNETYWALTGNYNAQIEQYRQEVAALQDDVGANTSSINEINNNLSSYDTRITNNANSITALQGSLDTTNSNLNTTNSNVSALEGRVSANANNITTLESYTLQGKEVHFFGDSLTIGSGGTKPYPTVFAELTGATVVNHAVSGARYCESRSGDTSKYMSTQIESASLSNASCVIIQCGINDFLKGFAIGSYNSTMNYFKGALYANLVSLINKMPASCMIRYISLFPSQAYYNGTTSSSNGLLFETYNTAIIETCNYLGIPVIDGTEGIGITRTNFSKLSSDGIHFNDTGYNIIGTSLAEIIHTASSMTRNPAPVNMIPENCFTSTPAGSSAFNNIQTDGRYLQYVNGTSAAYISSLSAKFTFVQGSKYTLSFDFNSTVPNSIPAGQWTLINFNLSPNPDNPSQDRTQLVSIANPETGTHHVNVTFTSPKTGVYPVSFGFGVSDDRAGTFTLTNICLTKGTIECAPNVYVQNGGVYSNYGDNISGEGSLGGIAVCVKDGNLRVSGAFKTTAQINVNGVILSGLPKFPTGLGINSGFRFLLAFDYNFTDFKLLGYNPSTGTIYALSTLPASHTYGIAYVCPMYY